MVELLDNLAGSFLLEKAAVNIVNAKTDLIFPGYYWVIVINDNLISPQSPVLLNI